MGSGLPAEGGGILVDFAGKNELAAGGSKIAIPFRFHMPHASCPIRCRGRRSKKA
jgi:hypothetical protein